jgi:hypothetical protein
VLLLLLEDADDALDNNGVPSNDRVIVVELVVADDNGCEGG